MKLMKKAGGKNSPWNDHAHGGNIYAAAGFLGVPAEEIIDFSASINPLGLSESVKEAIKRGIGNLIHYPDPDTKNLRYEISRHYGIDPDMVLCGNGSTELIYLLPRTLNPENVLIPAPTFSEYERACRLGGECGVARYELSSKNNFLLDPEHYVAAINGGPSPVIHGHESERTCDMAFLCNPNNPTGSLLSRKQVLDIAAEAEKNRCLLVVDEAFIDFCPEESVIHDVQDNPFLAVLRSMTKFYALTGLRAGYAVLHKDLMGRVQEFKEPWTVNSLAQKAAIAALGDRDYADESLKVMEEEKMYMEASFHKLGMEFIPSAANYYLLHAGNAAGIVQELKRKGILVRDCSNFYGLGKSYIRVAVKARGENEVLIQELSGLHHRKVQRR